MSLKILTRDVPPRSAWALEQAGIHPLLSRLFAARGVVSADELDDGLARLLPPEGMQGAQDAARLLADAIASQRGDPISIGTHVRGAVCEERAARESAFMDL